MKKKIYLLIRHGKTAGNIEKRYIGCRTDEVLCEAGIGELQNNILGNIEKSDIKKVYVSPLIRCRQTADILFPGVKQILEPELREIDFGEFENKNYKELSGSISYQKWLDSNGSLPFPQGESRETFIQRNILAFKKIVQKESQEKDNRMIPFVIHGGSIMAIMSELTGKDYYSFQIPCGSAFIITCMADEERIELTAFERLC